MVFHKVQRCEIMTQWSNTSHYRTSASKAASQVFRKGPVLLSWTNKLKRLAPTSLQIQCPCHVPRTWCKTDSDRDPELGCSMIVDLRPHPWQVRHGLRWSAISIWRPSKFGDLQVYHFAPGTHPSGPFPHGVSKDDSMAINVPKVSIPSWASCSSCHNSPA